MKNNKVFYGLWLALFMLITFAYRHHFDNSFHFDDGHTIQNNLYIRDIYNIPLFFTKGAETFSTLPANQVYRPVVSTSLAIDYWLSSLCSEDGSGYHTFYYHLSMFLEYLLLLVLFYRVMVQIFNRARQHPSNRWIALAGVAWYGIHTVNAETLNYIISRSDLLSSLFVLAAFDIFLSFPAKRCYGFFLIPFIVGMFTKLTAAMFGPLLVVYYFIFEFRDSYKALSGSARKKYLLTHLFALALITAVTAGGIVFVMGMQADTYTTGGSSRFLYLITQPFVLLHYFISFFIPYGLSADSDWVPLQSMFDRRFFVGMLFIVAMLLVFFKTWQKKALRPIALGLAWFFITLAPTSSVIPLAEVTNDHRMMYPFIGLMMGVIWSLALLYHKKEAAIRNNYRLKNMLVLLFAFILAAHTFGVMRRVEVWDNGKSLWYDVTVKSPKNGRGLMNYGLQLAAEGKFDKALEYYHKAQKYSPLYSYLYTNMAIAQNALGQLDSAEIYYKKALSLAPASYNGYYYYAIWLRSRGRDTEAINNFKKVVELAPQFVFSRYALMEYYQKQERWQDLKALVDDSYRLFPTDKTVIYYKELYSNTISKLAEEEKEAMQSDDPELLLKFSLHYYRQGQYGKAVEYSRRLIRVAPQNIAGYNNLVAALNMLGAYRKAIGEGSKGLALQGDLTLLRNNLEVSKRRLALQQAIKESHDPNTLINLSLQCYSETMYADCVKACRKALAVEPGNAIAYNNICSAYNAMKEWTKAIAAGEKALKLDPDFDLARNNLNYARKQLNNKH